MIWFLLLISIIFASLNIVLLHKLPEKSNIFVFNMICSGVVYVFQNTGDENRQPTIEKKWRKRWQT